MPGAWDPTPIALNLKLGQIQFFDSNPTKPKPKTQTQNPKLKTPNPKPQTPNPKPKNKITNIKLLCVETQNPKVDDQG